ncbi:hypothetical protein RI065_08455 [Mycoplasmatota bacterium zrk1]
MKWKFNWKNIIFYTVVLIMVFAWTRNDNIPPRIPIDKVNKVIIYDYHADYKNPIVREYTRDEIKQIIDFISELKFPFLIKSKKDIGLLSKYRIELDIGKEFPLVFEEDNGFLRYENENMRLKKEYYARYDRAFIGTFLYSDD